MMKPSHMWLCKSTSSIYTNNVTLESNIHMTWFTSWVIPEMAHLPLIASILIIYCNMYVCMYVCMYIYIYMTMYISMTIYTHIRLYNLYMYTCTFYVYHVCVHIYIYMYVHTYDGKYEQDLLLIRQIGRAVFFSPSFRSPL